MKRLRSILFWSHLAAGVLAGLVILVMSFTGAVLALKPQILDFVERDVRVVTPRDTPRLTPQQILAAASGAKPGVAPQQLSMERDPEAAAAVGFGRDAGTVYVNPYDGLVLGGGSGRANAFFQSVTSWHRYLNLSGPARETGKSATGIANLAFLFLALSGLWIWWPKELSARHLKPIVWFRRTKTPRARDFNWHNVIGFWCLPAIVVMAASGAVISYSWASDLVYRMAGSPIPERRGSGAPGGAGRGRPGEARREDREQAAPAVIPAEVDALWAQAEQQMPTWSQISRRLPARDAGPVQLTLTDGAHWNQFARSTLTISSRDGHIVQWAPYSASNAGQKARGWLRYAHTGELGYLPGQIVAGVGCLGGVMLVWTGLSLAIRRLWNWSLWTRWATAPGFDEIDVAADPSRREALDS